MTSADSQRSFLVRPAAWQFDSRFVLRYCAALACFVLLTVWLSFSLTQGDSDAIAPPGIAAFLAFFGFGVAMLTVGVFVSPNRKRARASLLAMPHHENALILRYSRAERLFAHAAMASLAMFLFAAPVFTHPSESERGALFFRMVPFLPLLGILPTIWLLGIVVRRRKQLAVGMGRDGIYHWENFGCHFFRWDWITEVHAGHRGFPVIRLRLEEPDARPQNPEENWVARRGFRRKSDGAHVIQVGALAANPLTTYYALNFYFRHPELRHELGTDTALQRIERNDFPGLAEEVRRYAKILPTAPKD